MNSNFLQNISREEIIKLPLGFFNGEIVLVDNQKKLEAAVNFLKKQDLLGFDTETKPAFKKGQKNKVALLQISTIKKAFLFRINNLDNFQKLFNIFGNSNITKIGADIGQDMRVLQKISPFTPQGFIDIQKYTGNFGILDNGLKKLAAIVLKIRISKSQQLTNWEAETLTEKQMIYAATDAWVCLKIYQTLNKV
ncbi:MAG: hypothetical protein A2X08_05390 [Bacteroidetes bacterium GWA2_32_17]|nr:MAG: hypothetical protein A2X08_05390 [Bacteroidetes bacterium GWA2_32_17]